MQNSLNKNNQKTYEIDMINGPLMPKLVTFFVPLMASSVLQLLFNAVDLIVVGKWAGSEALAAVGATTALIITFANLMMGISMGANVVAAGFIALEDREQVSETVQTSITLAIIMGSLVTILGIIFSKTCLTLMGTPPEIIGQSRLYMNIYLLQMPCFAVYNYGAAILRASGDTKRPMYYLIFAGILNAVLNMILVIVFHLDVAGVAIATAFSTTVSCILVIRCLTNTDEIYRLDVRSLHINIPIMKKILLVGIPSGLQTTVINFSNILLQSSVNSFGAVAMAGYTAANNILGFLYVSANSITQACMSFTSQNYAVRQYKRIKTIIFDCMVLECIVGLCLGGTVRLLGLSILHVYTDSPDVMGCGIQIFKYTALLYFLCGIMDCLPGAMRGLGRSTAPMIFAIIGTVGTRIVWIYGLFPSHRSLEFLFISYPVSWIITIIMQGLCLCVIFKKVAKK